MKSWFRRLPLVNAASRKKRILPAQLWKPREVAVGRDERQPMFDGESGEMGVGDELGAAGTRAKETAQDVGMRIGRSGNPNDVERQPLVDAAPDVGYRKSRPEDAGVRDDSNESEERRPWKPDSPRPRERSLEPRLRRLVRGKGRHRRRNEKVRVDENQRRHSPSAASKRAGMQSTLGTRQVAETGLTL